MNSTCKQMCLCSKVIYRVLANLTRRLCSLAIDVGYKMCIFCCFSAHRTDPATCEMIKETSEAFYKDVSREMVEKLLKNQQNGTFIIRPSNTSKLGTLSLVQDRRIFHLKIRRREQDNCIALGREKNNEKCFSNLNSLINYYVSNYLILCSNGRRIMTLLLPYADKNETKTELHLNSVENVY
ncbi:uncharacterized protein LOC109544440 [Dendroctonus ponderosae]|uniref:uncharacterized protein LOC109544440 n=1 Tax=Dendroctonus ponderosae TaxID=77166 RepID=UPI0020355071|nr:uncharacterized protein LOC109544440 [Dendroctonus ponderosae]KAH1025582.1 hypothetical protein HUJ05_010278 [Dendroctonus ponderosae]